MSGIVLVSTILSTLLLAVVAELVTRFFPKRPGLAQLLWLAVLLRSLFPSVPLISTGMDTAINEALPLNLGELSAPNNFLAQFGLGNIGISNLLFSIWFAVAVCLFLRSLHRNRKVCRWMQFGASVDPAFDSEIERESARIGISKPRVTLLPGIRSPFIYGTLKPTLVWPKTKLANFSEARSSVLLHELAHLKRRDPWTAWIELIASCLWWWNPLIGYSVAQSKRTKELACDAFVVAHDPERRLAYATALIEAIRNERDAAVPGQFLGWVDSRERVKERLRSIYSVRYSERLTPFGVASVLALRLSCTFSGSLTGARTLA